MIKKRNASTKCVEKAMKQLAILYRNARNLLKSNIDVRRTTRWRKCFIGTYVESWVMTGMKNITIMSHDQCMNPLSTSCCGTSKYRLITRLKATNLDIEVLDKIKRKCLVVDVTCPFDIRVKDMQRTEVETDLEIAQSNCGAKHNWCIRNCLERYRKVVGRDWCHLSFGITAESVLTGYSQNPLRSLAQ